MRLTRRDVRRIQALAESVKDGHIPAALDDLDGPWRVQALPPTDARRSSGEPFGEWAGCVLVAWWRPKSGISAAEHQEGAAEALRRLRQAAGVKPNRG